MPPEIPLPIQYNPYKHHFRFLLNELSEWQKSDWKKIVLTDQSEWLIKEGNLAERYIHIHPAKFSKHTIRVRATTLKTVLTLCVNKIPIRDDASQNLQTVNKQRSLFLQLSAIKSLNEKDSGILKLWQIFVNAETTN